MPVFVKLQTVCKKGIIGGIAIFSYIKTFVQQQLRRIFMNSDYQKIMGKRNILRTIRSMLFSVVLFTGIPAAVHAHPHVFIKNSVEFVWNDSGSLEGAYLTWNFDRFFSADIIKWLDVNHDGKFSSEESEDVYNRAFINLRHYYYYTFIRQGTTRTNPPKVTKFRATQKDGIMTYRFYIDLSKYTGQDLYLAVYDYTYFCDVEYPDNCVTFTCPSSVHPSCKIIENKQYPVYYDPLSPASDTRIYYKWAPGLQTYYPREMHLTW
jgi:ABC-type uncharacterized transport system substrate-binding protein